VSRRLTIAGGGFHRSIKAFDAAAVQSADLAIDLLDPGQRAGGIGDKLQRDIQIIHSRRSSQRIGPQRRDLNFILNPWSHGPGGLSRAAGRTVVQKNRVRIGRQDFHRPQPFCCCVRRRHLGLTPGEEWTTSHLPIDPLANAVSNVGSVVGFKSPSPRACRSEAARRDRSSWNSSAFYVASPRGWDSEIIFTKSGS
jgi:hypothetical protein